MRADMVGTLVCIWHQQVQGGVKDVLAGRIEEAW